MANIATGNTYTLGTVLQEVVGKNIRIFPIFMKQFKHFPIAFFDIKQLTGDGGYTIAPKNLPGIEPTITADGYSVKWLENSLYDFQTTIKGDQTQVTVAATTGLATLNVADTSGFAVNDSVYVILDDDQAGTELDGIVTSITDADTFVIAVTSIGGVAFSGTSVKVDLADEQTVLRGFWKRNDNEEITRPSAVYNYTEYHSYIQHFSKRIEFTKAEINKEYKYEGDAKAEVAARLKYNLGIIFQEISKAIYKGRNVKPGTGAQDKMEMLGLEEICRQKNAIVDISTSTTPIKDLYKQFELAQLSDATGAQGNLRILVNYRFLSEISRVRETQIRYDKKVDALDYVIPTMSTPFGEIDILVDPVLNQLYNYPVVFTLPSELIKLRVRPNQGVSENGSFTATDKSIHVYPVVHNLREKDLYDMTVEMGLIAGGLSALKSPYRMIKGFTAPAN
jgi:hypothetical protein